MTKLTKGFVLLFAALLIAQAGYRAWERAGNKPFWMDEESEMVYTCADSYDHMLGAGATSQCSRAPFYYLLQKFAFHQINDFSQGLLWKYRLVSLVAGLLLLASSYAFFAWMLSPLWGLVPLGLLLHQPLLPLYMAENRPYMVWLLLSGLCLWLFLRLGTEGRSRETSPVPLWIFLGLAALALAATTSASLVQLACMAAAWGASLLLSSGETVRSLVKRTAPWLIPASLVVAFVGLYYSSSPCVMTGDKFTLRAALAQGDWNPLKGVLRIVIPGGPFPIQLFNLFLPLGVFLPLYLRWKRWGGTREEKLLLSLSLQGSGQLVAFAVLGFLVYWKDYYFVQRVFIFALLPHAMLIVAGLWSVSLFLERRWGARVKAGIPLLAVFAIALPLARDEWQRIQQQPQPRPEEQRQCALWSQEVRPFRLQEVNPRQGSANFLVELGQELRRCGWPEKAKPGSEVVVFLGEGKTPSWRNAAGQEKILPITQCGQEIIFSLPAH